MQIFLANVLWDRFTNRSYSLSEVLSRQETRYIEILDKGISSCLRLLKDKMLRYDYYSEPYQVLKKEKEKLKSFRSRLKLLAMKISSGSEFNYKLRFFLLPYFIYQSFWFMLFASGLLIIRGRIRWGLNFSYFSLIFGFLTHWLVCLGGVGFVFNDPYIRWLNSFHHLVSEVSPDFFAPILPFSYLSLLKDFINTDRLFITSNILVLGLIFTFVLFYKFNWKFYMQR